MWHCYLKHLNYANIECLAKMTNNINLTDLLCLHCENIYKALLWVCNETDAQLIIFKYKKNIIKRKKEELHTEVKR